mgnify:CR=1 FL=1
MYKTISHRGKNMKKLMYFLAILASPLMLFAQEDVEEVIVTANKKEQSVQEIPMNISVITEQLLEDRGITSVSYTHLTLPTTD